MISSVLALMLATSSAQQAPDAAAAARNAYTRCLRQQMDRALDNRAELATFETAMTERCAAQETAFRNAVIEREGRLGGSRARAQEDAELEVDDAKQNFRDLFADSSNPG